jgi:hypothetical protein
MINPPYSVFSVLLVASYAAAQFSMPKKCFDKPYNSPFHYNDYVPLMDEITSGFSTCYQPALQISDSCQTETDNDCYCFALKLMDT